MYVTEPQVLAQVKEDIMNEVTEGASAEPASELPTLCPLSAFSASFWVRASFSKASCSQDGEPRRQVAPGLDPHGHRGGSSPPDPLREADREGLRRVQLGACARVQVHCVSGMWEAVIAAPVWVI